MAEVPLEGRNKYGDWDADSDEFADLLIGRQPRARRADSALHISDESPLDETFLRTLGDSSDKYGR